MHRNIEREKQRREQVLDIRHALAKEVTQKTREIAGWFSSLSNKPTINKHVSICGKSVNAWIMDTHCCTQQ